VYYDLTDVEGDPCTVTIAVSDDGGSTWSIDPFAVWGDVGEDIEPGANKHIVWNPAADIPGQTGDDFVVRVTADDGQGWDSTTRVSYTSSGGQPNGPCIYPAISADGHYVVFQSSASNIVPGGSYGQDIFLRDLWTEQTTQVSVNSSGDPGNSSSVGPAISADGQTIGFSSVATNLVEGDTNEMMDVFVHEPASGETLRVSVSSSGAQGNKHSSWVSNYNVRTISADGRFVAFESCATNLVDGDTNYHNDIFVHDRTTGETTRVSVSSDGEQANCYSHTPSISADGWHVAFTSMADNLVPNDTNVHMDIFVHDRATGETVRVNVTSDGEEANFQGEAPSISADGRFVAFHSDATNLVPGDTNEKRDVFVHDRATGETTRVSVSSTGEQANAGASFPAISGDGRYVAFDSVADNLVPDDECCVDVFVHDRLTGETIRVSVNSAGEGGTGGHSRHPCITPDGRFVAYHSLATNLVPDDTNDTTDVFLYDRLAWHIVSGDSNLFTIASRSTGVGAEAEPIGLQPVPAP